MTRAVPTDPAPRGANRFRRTLLNVLFASFGYVAIRLLIAPVRIKILTTLLTKEDYGLLTLIMLTVSFITLISSLGSLEYMVRKIPGQLADYQFGVLRTITTYFGLIAALIAILGIGLLLIWQPDKLNLSSAHLLACGIILVLTVHLTQLVYFLMSRSAYAQSRMLMLLYADGWFLPLLVLMWAVEVTVGFMLWLWAVWLVVSLVVSQVWVRTRELLRRAPSRRQFREIVGFGVPLLPMIMGEWIFQMQDRYVLLAFTDLEALANFTLCFNIAWVGVSTGGTLLDVLITEFYKMRNRAASLEFHVLMADPDLRHSFTMIVRYTVLISVPISAALWFGYMPIVLLLSDPKFADAASIMRWVAPIPILFLLVNISGRTLIAVDRGRVVGSAALVAAVMHLSLSIYLAPRMAERGVALASCIAYGFLALYLGIRVRFLQWINWRILRPKRLVAFCALTMLGFYGSVTYLPGHALLVLATGGGISLLAIAALGLVRHSDLHHLVQSVQYRAEQEEHPPPA